MIGFMSVEIQAEADFSRARRRAFFGRIAARLRRECSRLLAFDKIHLAHNRRGLGLRDLDVSKIGAAPLRTPVRIAGEVQSVTVVPQASAPTLEVIISDGSARAVGIFLGRRKIAGLRSGRSVMFEGVLQQERSRLLMLNPAYVLLDGPQG